MPREYYDIRFSLNQGNLIKGDESSELLYLDAYVIKIAGISQIESMTFVVSYSYLVSSAEGHNQIRTEWVIDVAEKLYLRKADIKRFINMTLT